MPRTTWSNWTLVVLGNRIWHVNLVAAIHKQVLRCFASAAQCNRVHISYPKLVVECFTTMSRVSAICTPRLIAVIGGRLESDRGGSGLQGADQDCTTSHQ